MIDPQEPKNGDFATYVENLVQAPRGNVLPSAPPGAVPSSADRKSARRAQHKPPAVGASPGASDLRAQMPDVLRKVLESRGGKETREAMEGLFRTARTPGTGTTAPAELIGVAGGAGRVMGRIGSLLVLGGVALVGLWIADTGLFDVFPDQAVPMVFVGMILRIIGAKLRGVAARNTA